MFNTGKSNKFITFVRDNWLLFYFVVVIVYFEFIYGLWTNETIGTDFLFPFLFSVSAGALLSLLSRLFGRKVNLAVSISVMAVMTFVYLLYLIYFEIFKVPLSLYSIKGAGDAFQFDEVIYSTIRNNLMAIFLFLLPIIPLIFLGRAFSFKRIGKRHAMITVLIIFTASAISLLAVNMTKDKQNSQYMLYYKEASPQLSVSKLGLLTTVRLDLQRLLFGFESSDVEFTETTSLPSETQQTEQTTQTEAETVYETPPETTATVPTTEEAPDTKFNMLDIDFNDLIANEKDETIVDMHKYFSGLEPSRQNEYTGMFKGKNLIFFVAESFYPYAISKELTPTLYEMSTEGFVFNNYYNPLFEVSTSDGEYTACLSLLPKPGVWSFYLSGKIKLPFAFGNQFRGLGYITKAYHDHTYTYYNRDISHPNMGYDYKGVGNGLNVKVTWPESDLEMITATTDEYLGDKPFHVYYLTVSGHLQYSFGGNNFIAEKNRKLVEDLPYSTAAKAYIAGNLEVEFAMKELIKRLDAAGQLENTVIALCPDHYPYGLSKSEIEELVGHKVESNFELFKGIFLLWNKGMKPVVVDKYCSSLDINPTISNLFGLEYDSRLLMGNDILSDTPPLVIFANRSWITDKARYNSMTDKVEFFDPNAYYDKSYITKIHNIVARKFKYSVKILENDYYSKLAPYVTIKTAVP